MGETMRRSDSGKSTVKAVLSIAFVFALAYSAAKIIPVYVSSYELQDYIRQQNPFWLTQRTPADAIRNHILAKAKDLDLPVEPDQVKVDMGGGVSVQLDYTVPVDLKVYTLHLHFTPAADNRQL